MITEKVERYIRRYLEKYQPYKNKWNYEDGCILSGAEYLYKSTGDSFYYDFIYNYLDKTVDEEGNLYNYSLEEFNIDNINSGKVLFDIYRESREERFKKAIENIYYQLKVQPRTLEGNFWHKGIYPYQVWLDGLYMAQPFYVRYETEYNKKEGYADIFKQFSNVKRRMYSLEEGLYYHAYDETKIFDWADNTTGLSKNFWGRSIGWYAMALIDVLDEMSEEIFEYHRELQKMFKELMVGVLRYQDEESGMWYQVMACEEREGNYLETSGSSMFAYALLKGVRLGYLGEEFKEAGTKAFEGMVKRFLVEKESTLSLENICHMAGLNGIGNNKKNRDGSYEYYLSEPVVSDDAKGVGPFIMAYSEYLVK